MHFIYSIDCAFMGEKLIMLKCLMTGWEFITDFKDSLVHRNIQLGTECSFNEKGPALINLFLFTTGTVWYLK